MIPALSKSAFNVANKNFLVTGGSQGLGLAISQALVKCGASRIGLMARTRSKGEAAAAKLSSLGDATVTFHETDISDPKSIETSFGAAIEELGR